MPTVHLPEPDRQIIANRAKITRDLRDLIGADSIIADEVGRRVFETDALTAYCRLPLAVVLPRTTQDVAVVLRYCHDNSIKLVARGAGTSLSGGAVPSEDAIVVSVSRMNQVLNVDLENRCAHVQAGITNLAISEAAATEGFFYAPDPASQIACTLAGNIATNASGPRCLKYGATSEHILGVKIVMMDGEIIDIGGQHLDAPGYDLLGLLIGSEGQFGVVTEATVRLLRSAEDTRPMLLGFGSTEAAIGCVGAIVGAGIVPVALEFMDKQAILACENFGLTGCPTDVENLLIVELEGSEDEVDGLTARVAHLAGPFAPIHIQAAESAADSDAIWQIRRAAFGAFAHVSEYYCLDGTIPVGQLPAVLPVIAQSCASYGLSVATVFHAGDGTLHAVIQYDANDPEQTERAQTCAADILRLCIEAGGTLSGEHGIGIEKRDLLHHQFSDTDIAVQMRVKTVFDPNWLLNSGKVFPLLGRTHASNAA